MVPRGCLVLGGLSAPGGVCSGGVCRVMGVPGPGGCLVETPLRDGHCCGWYAPYWNAFLLPVTPVCHSFCSQGEGVCLSACSDTTPPGSRYPLGADTRTRYHPPEQTPNQITTPWSRHPLGADTPLGTEPLWEQTPPRADTPQSSHPRRPDNTPLGADTPPGSRLQHTVYERPVRILLECILVI